MRSYVFFSSALILALLMVPLSAEGATTLHLNQPSDSDITENSVHLRWSKTQDWAFLRYEVWKIEGGSQQIVAEIDDYDQISYTVGGLNQNTRYSFYIKDVDSVGSQDSNTITVTTDTNSHGDDDSQADDDTVEETDDDDGSSSYPYDDDDIDMETGTMDDDDEGSEMYAEDEEETSDSSFIGMAGFLSAILIAFFICFVKSFRSKRY